MTAKIQLPVYTNNDDVLRTAVVAFGHPAKIQTATSAVAQQSDFVIYITMKTLSQ